MMDMTGYVTLFSKGEKVTSSLSLISWTIAMVPPHSPTGPQEINNFFVLLYITRPAKNVLQKWALLA